MFLSQTEKSNPIDPDPQQEPMGRTRSGHVAFLYPGWQTKQRPQEWYFEKKDPPFSPPCRSYRHHFFGRNSKSVPKDSMADLSFFTRLEKTFIGQTDHIP